MIYSYTSLSCYARCPRQFEHYYVKRDVQRESSPEADHGVQVHERIEHAIKGGIGFPAELDNYSPTLEALCKQASPVNVERTIYLDARLEAVEDKPTSGLVAKIDLLTFSGDGKRAGIIDWKTGKVPKRPDTLQQDLYALAVLAAHPEVERTRGVNVYLRHAYTSKPVEHTRQTAAAVGDAIIQRIAIIQSDEWFSPNPSPLCGWCAVRTCRYHPEHRTTELV